jgi:hypothetical protein
MGDGQAQATIIRLDRAERRGANLVPIFHGVAARQTSKPLTLRAACTIRPNRCHSPIRAARLDDLDSLDKALVVTVVSRECMPLEPKPAAPRSRGWRSRTLREFGPDLFCNLRSRAMELDAHRRRFHAEYAADFRGSQLLPGRQADDFTVALAERPERVEEVAVTGRLVGHGRGFQRGSERFGKCLTPDGAASMIRERPTRHSV